MLPKLFFNDSLEKIKRPNKNYNDCTVNVHKKEEEFYYDLKNVFKEHAGGGYNYCEGKTGNKKQNKNYSLRKKFKQQ